MAFFGKMAREYNLISELGKAKNVPLIFSIDENNPVMSDDGQIRGYLMEAQVYQGNFDEELAKAGQLDANPYVTNSRQAYGKKGLGHTQLVTPVFLEAIKEANKGEPLKICKQIVDEVTGEETTKVINTYFAKGNIGFGATGAFVKPQKIEKDEKDAAYNERNKLQSMDTPLTQEMLDRHIHNTELTRASIKSKESEDVDTDDVAVSTDGSEISL